MRDIRIYRITDAGPKGNQDACYVSEHDNGKALACIADGVSGQRDGKYTAEFIADYIEDWYDEEGDQIFRSQPETLKEKMLRLVMEMHEDLIAESDSSGLQPGSTLDLAVMGGRKVFVAHVGDSRVYLFDGRSMKRITEDQTVAEVEKTTGMKFNEIAESRKAHYLMQCIGIGKINPNIYEEDIPQNCDILLCTDGLSNRLTESDMAEELRKKQTGSDALLNLVKKARNAGEGDNITAVLIRRREKPDKRQNGRR